MIMHCHTNYKLNQIHYSWFLTYGDNRKTAHAQISAHERELYSPTMETESLTAHNVVRLLLNDFGYDEKLATRSDDYWIDSPK